MSCFKLTLGLCNEIENLIRKFWWGQKGDHRKIHWVKWETLCQPKSEWGMGSTLFDDVILAKQIWRLLHNKNSIFYWVFKSRFFLNCSFMEASEFTSRSYAWQSILRGRDELKRGTRWSVWCGDSISVWLDSWLPPLDHPHIQSPVVAGFEDMKVSTLINPMTRS